MYRLVKLGALVVGWAVLGVQSGLAQITRAPAPENTVPVTVEMVAKGLEHPWGLQVLPDGRMIVTERPGRIRLVDQKGAVSPPLTGVPAVAATNQGGMLDIVLAPDFAASSLLHICYAEPREGRTNGSTVARARLVRDGTGGRLDDVTIVFRQQPAATGGLHFGCRLTFAPDGRLFVALGERFQMQYAQDLSRHWGKVVRIEADGRVPADNPFVGKPDASPEIWSWGHRNPQSAAIEPESGQLWVVEHGPRGGDEVNIAKAGLNYGWPIIGYGIDYSGAKLHESAQRDGMEQPIYYWVPSIAPSGMTFYTSDREPSWKGNLFVGGLVSRALHRLVRAGDKIVGEEVLLNDVGERIRDVRQGPDGALWVLTDSPDGKLLKISPRAAR